MINLYIVDYYNLFKSNGLTTYVNQLTGSLPKAKVRLHYVWIKSNPEINALSSEVTAEGVTHLYVPGDINVPGNNNPSLSLDTAASDFIAANAEGKEHIIIHFNWINHTAFARLLKQKIYCKTLITKHCIPWRDSITSNYGLFKILEKRFRQPRKIQYHIHPFLLREQLAYKNVDHIICVTAFAKAALRKMFQTPEEKISVISNGLRNKPTRYPDKAALRKKYKFSADEKIILYAGAVNERKGVFDLVAAFDKVLELGFPIRLVIAGGGEVSKIPEKTGTNWSKITATGNLDKKTLFDFYRMADMGIIPSYIEQCSYSCIEMMHHGLPLIISEADGLNEMMPPDCGLKVKILHRKNRAQIDQDDLKNKICQYLDNPDLAERYAANARKHALRHFTAKKMTRQTVAVYEKLAGELAPESSLPGNESDVPLVSVILPCFNGEKYIKECIESVLRQTHTNFELIIINDASTDATAHIIGNVRDKRITYVRNEENTGIVKSLNRGVNLAKGKYIARIDADDAMHAERLEKQLEYLEANADVAMVGSAHFVIDQYSKMISLVQYPLTDAEIKALSFFRNPFSHPTVMIRAATLKKQKYSTRYPFCEDYYLWFNISKKWRVANLPDCLTYYRIHDANISRKNLKLQQQSVLQLLSDQLDKLGVGHSAGELATHAAICFGYGKKIFAVPEKIKEAKLWIDKVLQAQQPGRNTSKSFIKELRGFILENYCEVE